MNPKPRTIPLTAIWLAVGLLGGFGIAILAMNILRPPSEGNLIVQRDKAGQQYLEDAPKTTATATEDPAILVPKDRSTIATTPNTNSTNAEYAADRTPKDSAPPTMDPKPLPGSAIGTTGGGIEPLSPTVVIGDKPPAQVEHFEYLETTSETEFDGELAQAVAAIRKAGGQVLLQFEFDPERPERGTEVFAAIEHKSADKLRDALKQATGAEISQWSGTNSERIGRMQRALRDERSRLAQLLVEYQVKYMDDATQVLETKAAIARFDAALSALRRVGEDKATIRLKIGR